MVFVEVLRLVKKLYPSTNSGRAQPNTQGSERTAAKGFKSTGWESLLRSCPGD